mmetsp:Transcript_62564/g.183456  ORF Transcript_62564/g.183456 Transcript_62564/m.183456 type:complete len:321 (-) Transcript_62564:45-1007(-)
MHADHRLQERCAGLLPADRPRAAPGGRPMLLREDLLAPRRLHRAGAFQALVAAAGLYDRGELLRTLRRKVRVRGEPRARACGACVVPGGQAEGAGEEAEARRGPRARHHVAGADHQGQEDEGEDGEGGGEQRERSAAEHPLQGPQRLQRRRVADRGDEGEVSLAGVQHGLPQAREGVRRGSRAEAVGSAETAAGESRGEGQPEDGADGGAADQAPELRRRRPVLPLRRHGQRGRALRRGAPAGAARPRHDADRLRRVQAVALRLQERWWLQEHASGVPPHERVSLPLPDLPLRHVREVLSPPRGAHRGAEERQPGVGDVA